MTATTALDTLVCIAGILALGLGLALWGRWLYELVNLHMVLGVEVVLGLWALAVFALQRGTARGLEILALPWGLATPALGPTQAGLLVGELLWIVQVVHLLLGLGAVALAAVLAGASAERRPTDSRPLALTGSRDARARIGEDECGQDHHRTSRAGDLVVQACGHAEQDDHALRCADGAEHTVLRPQVVADPEGHRRGARGRRLHGGGCRESGGCSGASRTRARSPAQWRRGGAPLRGVLVARHNPARLRITG